MHIYIDESGSFTLPAVTSKVSIGCVASITIPSSSLDVVEQEVAKVLRKHFPSTEPKGNLLSEQIRHEIFDILSKYDVLVQAACVDLSMHSNANIKKWQSQMAAFLRASITDKHQPSMRKDVFELADRIEKLSLPLLAQFEVLNALIYNIIQTNTFYFAQRLPAELGNFHWIIDGKAKQETEFEKLWLEMLPAYLQMRTFKAPFVFLKESDYSFYSRFQSNKTSGLEDDEGASNIKMIMRESLKFIDSKDSIGIQLADIVANTIRRAFHGNLEISGFDNLGQLMAEKFDFSHPITFLSLDENLVGNYSVPYGKLLTVMRRGNKKRLIDEFDG